jgi:hypothetical protein
MEEVLAGSYDRSVLGEREFSSDKGIMFGESNCDALGRIG